MTGQIIVRPAEGPSDDDAIWAILKPIVEGGREFCAPPDGGRDGAFAYFAPPEAQNFVAELNGEIVGASYLKPNQGGGGSHVCNAGYATAPAARGKGVARALLAHSLATARSAGYRAMQYNFVVATNTRAIETWVRAGFEIVGTLEDAFLHPEAGYVNAHVMMKDLTRPD